MADELESGAAEGQSAETTTNDVREEGASIRDTLRSAYDEHQKDDTGEGRGRDASGRFVPKAGDPQAQALDDPAAAQRAKTGAQPGAEQQPITEGATQAPKHWTEADKAAFAKAPPEVQARWIEREQQFQRAYTDVTQKLKGAENVMRHFEPHAAAMKTAGLSPEHYVGGWIKIEQRLMSKDPGVFAEAVKAYGYDPAAVVAALGGQAPAGGQQQEERYTDPEVATLKTHIANLERALMPRVQSIESHLTTQQESAQKAAVDGVVNQITEFASEKSGDGQLAHPYYAEVEETMLMLAQGEISAGKQLTVKDITRLYEAATYAHPDVRAKVLADQRRADETKRTAEAKAKAVAARTAGSSVAGSPSAGLAPTAQGPNSSVRDTLRRVAAEVSGR